MSERTREGSGLIQRPPKNGSPSIPAGPVIALKMTLPAPLRNPESHAQKYHKHIKRPNMQYTSIKPSLSCNISLLLLASTTHLIPSPSPYIPTQHIPTHPIRILRPKHPQPTTKPKGSLVSSPQPTHIQHTQPRKSQVDVRRTGYSGAKGISSGTYRSAPGTRGVHDRGRREERV